MPRPMVPAPMTTARAKVKGCSGGESTPAQGNRPPSDAASAA